MKIFKTFIKISLVVILLIVIITGSIALYMKFFGKQLIQDRLGELIGRKLEFESMSWDLSKAEVNFKGFTIPEEIDFENKTFLNAEKFSVILDKNKFDKEKKIVINELIVEKAMLNIERNKKGKFNVSNLGSKKSKIQTKNSKNKASGIAYAAESASNPVYNFVKNVKKLTIKNSVINFKDYYIPNGPCSATLKDLSVNVSSSPDNEKSSGSIPVQYNLSLKIEGKERDGALSVAGGAACYKTRVDTELNIDTEHIDIMQFLPYFEHLTPFIFHEGVFSSNTKIACHNNMLNSLTTMVFHRLRLETDPDKENTEFLQVAVNKLEPYLTSGSGEIIFDFVIKGPVEKPSVGIGPKVKTAIGMAVMDEVIRQLQNMQK